MKPANKQRYALRAVALGAAMCAIAAGHAAEIVTDNPDLSVRFDNTIKYNYANRISDQNAAILKSVNNDDGDRNFNKGTVSNRLDLLSEFDLVWQNRMGFRISGAAWDDAAYNHLDNTNVASSNHLGADGKPAIGLSDYASRYQKGPSGEILDAFVFGRFELGDMPVNVKLGQHTLYWGESVLSPIHGVNYGQSALDLIKGYSVPGSDAKELFLPRRATSRKFSRPAKCSFARRPSSAGSRRACRSPALSSASTITVSRAPRASTCPAWACRRPSRRRTARRQKPPTSASPRAGARSGWMARWACICARPRTSCRRRTCAWPACRRRCSARAIRWSRPTRKRPPPPCSPPAELLPQRPRPVSRPVPPRRWRSATPLARPPFPARPSCPTTACSIRLRWVAPASISWSTHPISTSSA